jgi:hypothetical protein
VSHSIQAFTTTPTARVDSLLFRVRWVLFFLVLPVVWFDLGGSALPTRLLLWLAIAVIANIFIGLFLQFPVVAKLLPIPALIVDTLIFGILPYIAFSGSNLLAYFSIFPAVVAAIRSPRTSAPSP